MKNSFADRNAIRMVLEQEQADIIAQIVTPWHLLGLSAYLHSVSGTALSVWVVILPHAKNGFMLLREQTQEYLKEYGDVHTVYPCDAIPGGKTFRKRVQKGERKRLTLISTKIPMYTAGLRIPGAMVNDLRYVILDEGAGCYHMTAITEAIVAYNDTGRIFGSMKHFLRILFSQFLNRLYAPRIQYFTLLREHGKMLVQNEHVAREYRQVITGGNTEKLTFDTEYVLMLTQPLVEDGSIGLDDYIDMLDQLRRQLQKRGIAFYVRPHPRETELSKYESFKRIKGNFGSAEQLYMALSTQPLAVLGFHSTTLYTAKALIDALAVSLDLILIDRFCGLRAKQESLEFQKNFPDIVCFPKTTEEAVEAIDKGGKSVRERGVPIG